MNRVPGSVADDEDSVECNEAAALLMLPQELDLDECWEEKPGCEGFEERLDSPDSSVLLCTISNFLCYL